MINIKTVSIQYLPTLEESDKTRTLKAGKFLFPGFTHEYPVFGKEIYGGKYKYTTGLNEKDVEDTRKEEVTEARQELEKYFGEGTLDDSNVSFWKDQRVVINKTVTHLNLQNPQDKLLYYVIKAGGIDEIAPSYDAAVNGSFQKRWYLVEPEEYADLSAQINKYFDKAIASLVMLDEEGTFDDMFIVHKVLITSDRGTTKQTPKSALYKDLSDFIHGKIVRTDKKKTPKQFTETVQALKKDKKRLYVQAYVKEASYFNYLSVAEDNQFQNIETKTKYGASIEKATAFLSNPGNQTELENVKERVEKRWSE